MRPSRDPRHRPIGRGDGARARRIRAEGCVYCRRQDVPRRQITLEHVIPRGWGMPPGEHGWNLALACRNCNRAKSRLESLIIGIRWPRVVPDRASRDPRELWQEFLHRYDRALYPFDDVSLRELAARVLPRMQLAMRLYARANSSD